MKKRELLDILEKVPDEAEIYIAGEGNRAEIANKVFWAEELDEDGQPDFQDIGFACGAEYGVLITREGNE